MSLTPKAIYEAVLAAGQPQSIADEVYARVCVYEDAVSLEDALEAMQEGRQPGAHTLCTHYCQTTALLAALHASASSFS